LTTARGHLMTVVLDNYLYALGGQTGTTLLDTSERALLGN
jgi:hypothetical protein